MKIIGFGLDSIVYKDNEEEILKVYWRRKQIIKKYHNLQNDVSKLCPIKFEFNGILGNEKFNCVEIKVLELSDTIEENTEIISNKLSHILGFGFTKTKQEFIAGETFENNVISRNEKKKIMLEIVKQLKKFLNYNILDLHSKNIKIKGIENGLLKLVITDLGASIRFLLFRNN